MSLQGNNPDWTETIKAIHEETDAESDFTEATPAQRIEVLEAILGKRDDSRSPYQIQFNPIRVETFPRSRHGANDMHRQHYVVVVTNNNTQAVETFDYFQGEKIDPIKRKGGDFSRDRLISFLYCIVSDYDMVEHEGIKDCFDLMDNFGYTNAREARNMFEALRISHEKINRVFARADWSRIEKIVEGY